jgi:hypothetical protein
MVDAASELWLEHPGSGPCRLTCTFYPHAVPPIRPSQRLVVRIGGIEVFRAALAGPQACDVAVPDAVLRQPGPLRVSFEHPDAITPAAASGSDDVRNLAMAVRELWLYRPEPVEPPAPSPAPLAARPSPPQAPAISRNAAPAPVVFVGNCQMGALARLYRHIRPDLRDADVTYVPSYEEANEADRRRIAEAGVLVQQVVDFAPRIGDLPTRGRVHLVPHATAAFLWPYGGTPHPRNRPEPTLDLSGPYPAELGDSFLNKAIAAGMAPDAAVTSYLATDVPQVRRIDRLRELHMAKQRDRDQACGIPVADRIESQFQTTCLFRTANHPEPPMMLWLAAEVFARMGEPPAALALLESGAPEVMPPSEMPIHPAVAEHFGLGWATAERRYRFFDEGGFTFSEYAGRYMRYEWNALLAEGMHLLWKRETRAGVEVLKRAVPSAPRSAVARMALADALESVGDVKAAVDYAYQAVAIEPDNEHYARRLMQISDTRLRRDAEWGAGVQPSVAGS